MCLAAPHIANILSRFPVKPKGCIRYVHCSKDMLNWIDLIREVFHALGWRNDERYHAPMCVSPVGNVLGKDFVEFNWEESHRTTSYVSMRKWEFLLI